ncbi:MAG: ATP-grasp domain-containing protein [Planctomycetota bacterium]
MKILAFEFLSGGGVAKQLDLDCSMVRFQRQGSSMLESVCRDFLLLGHEVILPLDSRLELEVANYCSRVAVDDESNLDDVLCDAAGTADAILVICPESGGCLLRYLQLLDPWSEKLVSPDSEFVKLTADKWRCFQWLQQRGVPCPRTFQASDGSLCQEICENFKLPVVVKPNDGAGSEGVRLISNRKQLSSASVGEIVQEYIVGIPVSVSLITSRNADIHFCEPGEQIFASYPLGPHVRTRYPISPYLQIRAKKLARQVSDALPRTRGYFGIDMVLAEDENRDVVIEVNPRLTTSYCELRCRSEINLAAEMLK